MERVSDGGISAEVHKGLVKAEERPGGEKGGDSGYRNTKI